MCRFPKAVKKEERIVHGCSYYFDFKNFPVQNILVKNSLLLLFHKSSSTLNPSSHPFPSYLLCATSIQLSQPSSWSASNVSAPKKSKKRRKEQFMAAVTVWFQKLPSARHRRKEPSTFTFFTNPLQPWILVHILFHTTSYMLQQFNCSNLLPSAPPTFCWYFFHSKLLI